MVLRLAIVKTEKINENVEERMAGAVKREERNPGEPTSFSMFRSLPCTLLL